MTALMVTSLSGSIQAAHATPFPAPSLFGRPGTAFLQSGSPGPHGRAGNAVKDRGLQGKQRDSGGLSLSYVQELASLITCVQSGCCSGRDTLQRPSQKVYVCVCVCVCVCVHMHCTRYCMLHNDFQACRSCACGWLLIMRVMHISSRATQAAVSPGPVVSFYVDS